MNISEVFHSEYLKCADLKGRVVKVKIESVDAKKIGDDRKLVVKFVGKEKSLVMNKTNANVVATAFGGETEGWIDREIELRPDKTQFQGQTVDCLRVQIPAVHADEINDPIPF